MEQGSLFLAEHLHELNVLEDDHEKITTGLATIAAVYKGIIAETVLMCLLSQLDTVDSTKVAAISYFRGAGLLNVQCDCHNDDLCDINNSESAFWMRKGANDCEILAPQYSSTKIWIESLSKKLY